MPSSRTRKVFEKGGFSNLLWKGFECLFRKILKHPEMDKLSVVLNTVHVVYVRFNVYNMIYT